VEFFHDGQSIGQGTLANGQYTLDWSPAPGTYAITARAIDSTGAVTDTAPAAEITVSALTATLYYIHPDHLGTPREITRASDNQIVWKWDDQEAFGNSHPDENPSGIGVFAYNLRFPGQYYDQESGTYYNYFRDYDPSIGRYIESDPLGLRAGINTYAYVAGDPMGDMDPKGLTAAGAALPLLGGAGGAAGEAGAGAAAAAGLGAAAAVGAAGAVGYGIGTLIYPGIEPGLSKGIDWVCSVNDKRAQCIKRCNVAYDETVRSVCSKMLTEKGRARCRYSALVVKTTCVLTCIGNSQ
jgi:RHS repeat-associated protein